MPMSMKRSSFKSKSGGSSASTRSFGSSKAGKSSGSFSSRPSSSKIKSGSSFSSGSGINNNASWNRPWRRTTNGGFRPVRTAIGCVVFLVIVGIIAAVVLVGNFLL